MDHSALQSVDSTPHRTTNKAAKCDAEHCQRPAISSLERRSLCISHFIKHSYDRLQQCESSPFALADDNPRQPDDHFLRDCAEQAAHLACPAGRLENLERARLYDIFLWASEIISKRDLFRTGTIFKAPR